MASNPPGVPDDHEEPFCLAVGNAVITWSQIEHYLAFYFAKITGMDVHRAKHIFFAASGFSSRHTPLSAALRATDVVQQGERDFLTAVLKKTKQWSDARNFIIHGVTSKVTVGNVSTLKIVEGGWLPEHIATERDPFLTALDEQNLLLAAANFHKLSDILLGTSLEKMRPRSAPKPNFPELELQVRLLPNDPLSGESAQTLAGREQQIRADLQRRAQTRNT